MATVAIIVILVAAPKTGLRIMWGIAIPLLPILFFLAPGLWRNICPPAASNQTPRVLGWTHALEPATTHSRRSPSETSFSLLRSCSTCPESSPTRCEWQGPEMNGVSS
ncbi:MAG TPA: hypothetical protein VEF89_30040 [Solirubrobacteraceae bacterium]|nr:hypothetical protein [Solirubrobacteraceae bacterium]